MSRRFKPNAVEFDEKHEYDDSEASEEREKGNYKRRRGRRLLLGGCDYKKGIKRANELVVSPISKFQKLFKGCKKSTTSNNLSSRNTARIGNYCCCMCLSKPQTLDTNSDELDLSDPNVSPVYLKSLIENNDFYCKECNIHVE